MLLTSQCASKRFLTLLLRRSKLKNSKSVSRRERLRSRKATLRIKKRKRTPDPVRNQEIPRITEIRTPEIVSLLSQKTIDAIRSPAARAGIRNAHRVLRKAITADPVRTKMRHVIQQLLHRHLQEMLSPVVRERARSSSTTRTKTNSQDLTDVKMVRADAAAIPTTSMTKELLKSRNVIRENTRPSRLKSLLLRNFSLKALSL